MSTELIIQKPAPGLYATKQEHVLASLTDINDQPYWSLNLIDEDTDFGMEDFTKWTQEAGYHYFVEIQKNEDIDRIYAVKVNGIDATWYVLHGTSWAGYVMMNGKMVTAPRYLGLNWPEDITVMMHGTWTAVRYFNIIEAVGYEPDDFTVQMARDMANLHKAILSVGQHYLRTDALPAFPQEI